MTSTAEDLHDVKPGRQRLSLALAVGMTVPGILVRATGGDVGHVLAAATQGICAAPQQHLQQLALRGRLAGEVARSFSCASPSSYEGQVARRAGGVGGNSTVAHDPSAREDAGTSPRMTWGGEDERGSR